MQVLRAVTLKKKMTFDQLKAELSALDKHPYESDIVKQKAIVRECDMLQLALLIIKFGASLDCVPSARLKETYQRNKVKRERVNLKLSRGTSCMGWNVLLMAYMQDNQFDVESLLRASTMYLLKRLMA